MSTKKTSGWEGKTKATIKKTEAPKETNETKKETKETNTDVIGSLKGGKQVHQKLKAVRVKALMTPISKRELPEDIARWLTNKGYGTNVYLQPKEWLERHHVDMNMVEKLKKFINDKYL